jgi:hypothetical protein
MIYSLSYLNTNLTLPSYCLGYGLHDQGFKFQQGLGAFLFMTVSRLAQGPTQPPIQWIRGAVSLGVKQSGHEAGHSPLSSAKFKNAWSYTSTPPVCLHGMVLS